MSQFDIEVPSEPVTSRFGIEASRSEPGTSQFDIEASPPLRPMLRRAGEALWP